LFENQISALLVALPKLESENAELAEENENIKRQLSSQKVNIRVVYLQAFTLHLHSTGRNDEGEKRLQHTVPRAEREDQRPRSLLALTSKVALARLWNNHNLDPVHPHSGGRAAYRRGGLDRSRRLAASRDPGTCRGSG
jgi:hypothetical protein